jgi:predicted kinase
VLIVVSGLPGTGKSAVAEGLAARLKAVHLAIDPIEDALLDAGPSIPLVTARVLDSITPGHR